MSDCDGEESLAGLCPAVSLDVRWEDWWEAHLQWPLVAQLGLTVVFLFLLEPLYVCAVRSRVTWFRETVKNYFGTHERPEVPQPKAIIVVFVLQILGSITSVSIWVFYTYRRAVVPSIQTTELAIVGVDLLTWAVNRLRGRCKAIGVWELNSLIDTLTVVPALQHALGFTPKSNCDWLSLRFLRSYQTFFCFTQIQETGHLQYNAVMVQMLIQVLFQVYCMLTMMAGAIFTCEVLGDPPFMSDNFIDTQFGDRISFPQMVYWVMMSVTTVGYGDFAPRALTSRILTSVFVMIGVSAVFLLQFRVSEFVKRCWEGSGSYRPKPRPHKHVVVMLCLSGASSKMSTMVGGFLKEILHASHDQEAADEPSIWSCRRRRKGGWPDVVIFSTTNWDDPDSAAGEDTRTTFKDFLRQCDIPLAARSRVFFIVGKVSSKADLDRAAVGSSTMTFLLSDVNSECPDEADGQNIFLAVVLRNLYSRVRLRLMLLRPESKELAVQAGVPVTRCFSARELKANMLAQNVRCHGLVPMITSMMCSGGEEDEEYFLRTADCTKGEASTSIDLHGAGQTLRRAETLESMRTRLRNSNRYWRKDKEEYELCDPWMFDYFGGLQRGVYGFELSEQYEGLSFGELVYAAFRDTGALVIGMFESGKVVLCPQHTHKNLLTAGTVCFAVAEKSSSLDRLRLSGNNPEDWRYHIMAANEMLAITASRYGAHIEAIKVCSHQLHDVLVAPRPGPSGSMTGWTPSMCKTSSEWAEHTDEREVVKSNTSSMGGILSRRTNALPTLKEGEGEAFDFRAQMSAQGGRFRTTKDPLKQVRELRKNLGENEELIVLIVCQGEVWQQVRTFITCLRGSHLRGNQSIVVLVPKLPPKGLFDDLGPRVVMVKGSPLSARALLNAGILEASAVVVMTGEATSRGHFREPLFLDHQVMLIAQSLECWCGISDREVFTTYELQDSCSVHHLPELQSRQSAKLRELLENKHIPASMGKASLVAMTWESSGLVKRGRNSRTSNVSGMSADERAGRRRPNFKSSVLFHPRFAAGQVFTPEVWGAMLGRAFYNPAIIEIVEALVMPHRRSQVAYPWQIRVPQPYVGRPYIDLIKDMALGGWDHDLETDFEPEQPIEPQGRRFSLAGLQKPPSNEVWSRQSPEGPAVPIAIYRARDDIGRTAEGLDQAQGTGGHNYNILAPPPATILRDEDWILVMASKSFGNRVQELGLLRGSVPDKQSFAHVGSVNNFEMMLEPVDSGSVGAIPDPGYQGGSWHDVPRLHETSLSRETSRQLSQEREAPRANEVARTRSLAGEGPDDPMRREAKRVSSPEQAQYQLVNPTGMAMARGITPASVVMEETSSESGSSSEDNAGVMSVPQADMVPDPPADMRPEQPMVQRMSDAEL